MVLVYIISIGILVITFGYFTLVQLGSYMNACEAALAKALTEEEKKKIKVKYLKKESFMVALSCISVIVLPIILINGEIMEEIVDWVSKYVSGSPGVEIVSFVLTASMILIPSWIVSIVAGKIGENQYKQ